MQPNAPVVFTNNPFEQTQYDSLKSKLFDQVRPDGELELLTFERYAFATHQAARMRQFEIDAQQRWTNEPTHLLWFHQMERLQKLAVLQERRADRAFTELRKLQRDRLSALDVQNELFLLDQFTPIPATLPIAEMRKSAQDKTSPATIAMMLMSTTPEIKAILSGQAKPKPVEPVQLSPEDLLQLHQNTKR